MVSVYSKTFSLVLPFSLWHWESLHQTLQKLYLVGSYLPLQTSPPLLSMHPLYSCHGKLPVAQQSAACTLPPFHLSGTICWVNNHQDPSQSSPHLEPLLLCIPLHHHYKMNQSSLYMRNTCCHHNIYLYPVVFDDHFSLPAISFWTLCEQRLFFLLWLLSTELHQRRSPVNTCWLQR